MEKRDEMIIKDETEKKTICQTRVPYAPTPRSCKHDLLLYVYLSILSVESQSERTRNPDITISGLIPSEMWCRMGNSG